MKKLCKPANDIGRKMEPEAGPTVQESKLKNKENKENILNVASVQNEKVALARKRHWKKNGGGKKSSCPKI